MKHVCIIIHLAVAIPMFMDLYGNIQVLAQELHRDGQKYADRSDKK